jgi:hypothetical protein
MTAAIIKSMKGHGRDTSEAEKILTVIPDGYLTEIYRHWCESPIVG